MNKFILILALMVASCGDSINVEKVEFETFKPGAELDRIMLMLDLAEPKISKEYFANPEDFNIKVGYANLDDKPPLEIFVRIEHVKYCRKEDCLTALISPPKSLDNKDWTLMFVSKGQNIYLSSNYTNGKKDFYLIDNYPHHRWSWQENEYGYEYEPDTMAATSSLRKYE